MFSTTAGDKRLVSTYLAQHWAILALQPSLSLPIFNSKGSSSFHQNYWDYRLQCQFIQINFIPGNANQQLSILYFFPVVIYEVVLSRDLIGLGLCIFSAGNNLFLKYNLTNAVYLMSLLSLSNFIYHTTHYIFGVESVYLYTTLSKGLVCLLFIFLFIYISPYNCLASDIKNCFIIAVTDSKYVYVLIIMSLAVSANQTNIIGTYL